MTVAPDDMVGTASPAPAAATVAPPAPVQPSLLEFERAIARRDYPTALNHTLLMLNVLDRSMGMVDGIDLGGSPPPGSTRAISTNASPPASPPASAT